MGEEEGGCRQSLSDRDPPGRAVSVGPGAVAEQMLTVGNEVLAAVAIGTGGWTRLVGPLLESWVGTEDVGTEVWAGEAGGADETVLDREEAGADINSDSAAGAGVAGADMEAGAETVEAGAVETGSGAEAEALIPLKDPDRCDPSMSTWTEETDTGLLFSLACNITTLTFSLKPRKLSRSS